PVGPALPRRPNLIPGPSHLMHATGKRKNLSLGKAAALPYRIKIPVGPALPRRPNFNPQTTESHARDRNRANPPHAPPIQPAPDSREHIAICANNFHRRANDDESLPPEKFPCPDAFWQNGLSRNQSSVRS